MEPAEWVTAAITCEITGDSEALGELIDQADDPIPLLRLAVFSSAEWVRWVAGRCGEDPVWLWQQGILKGLERMGDG